MAQASGVPDRLRPIDERILRLLAADGIQVRLDIERRLALSNCVTASRCRSLAERNLVRNTNWCCYEITERGKQRLRAEC
ncbi:MULTISPECIES: hypothetical protein [unclassified Haladaptatus]|uniref:hypothetical protein n=1 Tax=unclassified Haladaptatus TaxID=2622732 RepID=UPI00209BC8E5|nr:MULTISPECIES: hypothetical protein [unclassified Haladaptatus]MCO8243054.1 hypothetical protein [Haladaptatus sp. AB643]MCO8252768.1 hypothetical protein [Haladaptatus sp. AB618]